MNQVRALGLEWRSKRGFLDRNYSTSSGDNIHIHKEQSSLGYLDSYSIRSIKVQNDAHLLHLGFQKSVVLTKSISVCLGLDMDYIFLFMDKTHYFMDFEIMENIPNFDYYYQGLLA